MNEADLEQNYINTRYLKKLGLFKKKMCFKLQGTKICKY